MMPQPAILDFETEAIASRPDYPPKPVGYSFGYWKKRPCYRAWGHPTENNCKLAEAKNTLREPWNDKDMPLLMHHSKFDYAVATEKLGLRPLPWHRLHDTLYLLFFSDPHQRSLSLKPSAERLLKMPPDEQEAVKEWVLGTWEVVLDKHGEPKLDKFGNEKMRRVNAHVPDATERDWGAYIALAPGRLVGKYADGDIARTKGIFKHLYTDIEKRGMLPAYNRERQLMPILLANEQQGIRVDLDALERDIPIYEAALLKADKWIRNRLGVASDFNIDSDEDLGEALEANNVIPEDKWVLTATGKKSVAKKNLPLSVYKDKKLASALGYRNRLTTCLNMFMLKWREVARQTQFNTIHCSWNQVRQSRDERANNTGARTGRLSSEDPNFQNFSKNFENRGDGYEHPAFLRVPHLPLVRAYILPDPYSYWLHRDYSQQELRLLAHYEDGPLLAAYNEKPDLDVHGIVKQAIKDIVGRDFIRTYVKNYVFQKIYGGGIPAICAALGCDVATAKQVIAATMAALPGYDELDSNIKSRAKDRTEYENGFPIVTWGGRVYHTEPPSFNKKFGYRMTYEYKLLNYLIQGSAGDMTKEALIRYDTHPKREGRLLVTVHDEINISSPPAKALKARKDGAKREMKVLKECMEDIPGFDLLMLSEGGVGLNWGALVKGEIAA